jgi:hypothetical protein
VVTLSSTSRELMRLAEVIRYRELNSEEVHPSQLLLAAVQMAPTGGGYYRDAKEVRGDTPCGRC